MRSVAMVVMSDGRYHVDDTDMVPAALTGCNSTAIARKNRPLFLLATHSFRRMSCLFFEMRWTGRPSTSQLDVREPREIRGRLRHCNGLQTPKATGRASGSGRRERGLRPEVRIPVWLCSSWSCTQDSNLSAVRSVRGQLLRQREG